MAKDHMLRVRLSKRDLAKLQAIATVTDGNLSDAIRLIIHAAQLVVKPTTVIECNLVEDTLWKEDV